MADTKSIIINLYLLERVEPAGYDEWPFCLVAAATEKEARSIANGAAKIDANGYVWTDGSKVTSTYLGVAADGIHGVVAPKDE